MKTLDLDALGKFVDKAQQLREIAAEVQPFLELLKNLDGKDLLLKPPDRLIRAKDAAKILCVGQDTIGKLVKAGLLTPLYVNSEQRKFWLSEVMKLPRTKPWQLEV
ncbi:MAG: hypothetical protein IJ774_14445 [Selenomonadaceae bacterium]|nr:hypothetical protein [Selenomonadaceae bacterium]